MWLGNIEPPSKHFHLLHFQYPIMLSQQDLQPPSNLQDEYVPPDDVLLYLPDRRNYPPNTPFPPTDQFEVESYGPVLLAATIKDIRVLQGLLRHGFPPMNYIVGPVRGSWTSSLIRSLRAGPDFDSHVKLIVESGGTPDGFPLECFQTASSGFLRGRELYDNWICGAGMRLRSKAIADVLPAELRLNQTMALTDEELNDRRITRSRFWAEATYPRLNECSNNPPNALAVAIAKQNIPIYEYLVSQNSDESAWTNDQKYVPLSDDLPASYFVAESPMLVSIENEDTRSLEYLLSRGHKPDNFPMVLLTRCMNPIMSTIAKQEPWIEGFNMLAPYADLSLLTPIFRCHILHFAVATHELSLIQHVIHTMGGISAAKSVPSTALGHNLLHIASLPIQDSIVNMHSRKIWSSIHEFRTTSHDWEPQHLVPEPDSLMHESGGRGRGRGRGFPKFVQSRRGTLFLRRIRSHPTFRYLSSPEREAQAAVILYLIQHEIIPRSHLSSQDVHGNTALHYLTCVRNPDYDLIWKIREKALDDIWSHVRNIFGFTAEELDEEGRIQQVEPGKCGPAPFWNDGENSV